MNIKKMNIEDEEKYSKWHVSEKGIYYDIKEVGIPFSIKLYIYNISKNIFYFIFKLTQIIKAKILIYYPRKDKFISCLLKVSFMTFRFLLGMIMLSIGLIKHSKEYGEKSLTTEALKNNRTDFYNFHMLKSLANCTMDWIKILNLYLNYCPKKDFKNSLSTIAEIFTNYYKFQISRKLKDLDKSIDYENKITIDLTGFEGDLSIKENSCKKSDEIDEIFLIRKDKKFNLNYTEKLYNLINTNHFKNLLGASIIVLDVKNEDTLMNSLNKSVLHFYLNNSEFERLTNEMHEALN